LRLSEAGFYGPGSDMELVLQVTGSAILAGSSWVMGQCVRPGFEF